MTDTRLTDEALLRAYSRGRDADAFAELVRRHRNLVYGLCLGITGNRSDAEDAVQEVFIALARQAKAIRGQLSSWLFVVARRQSWRRQRSRSGKEVALLDHDVLWEPEHRCALIQEVDQALVELPEQQRAVLLYRFVDGLRQQDIAAELGVSQASVHRLIDKAVQALRRGMRSQAKPAVALSALAVSPPAALTEQLGRLSLGLVGGAGLAAGVTGSPVVMGGLILLIGSVLGALSTWLWWGSTGPEPAPASEHIPDIVAELEAPAADTKPAPAPGAHLVDPMLWTPPTSRPPLTTVKPTVPDALNAAEIQAALRRWQQTTQPVCSIEITRIGAKAGRKLPKGMQGAHVFSINKHPISNSDDLLHAFYRFPGQAVEIWNKGQRSKQTIAPQAWPRDIDTRNHWHPEFAFASSESSLNKPGAPLLTKAFALAVKQPAHALYYVDAAWKAGYAHDVHSDRLAAKLLFEAGAFVSARDFAWFAYDKHEQDPASWPVVRMLLQGAMATYKWTLAEELFTKHPTLSLRGHGNWWASIDAETRAGCAALIRQHQQLGKQAWGPSPQHAVHNWHGQDIQACSLPLQIFMGHEWFVSRNSASVRWRLDVDNMGGQEWGPAFSDGELSFTWRSVASHPDKKAHQYYTGRWFCAGFLNPEHYSYQGLLTSNTAADLMTGGIGLFVNWDHGLQLQCGDLFWRAPHALATDGRRHQLRVIVLGQHVEILVDGKRVLWAPRPPGMRLLVPSINAISTTVDVDDVKIIRYQQEAGDPAFDHYILAEQQVLAWSWNEIAWHLATDPAFTDPDMISEAQGILSCLLEPEGLFEIQDTAAALHARLGQWPEAIRLQQQAIRTFRRYHGELVRQKQDQMKQMQARLRLYQSNKPFGRGSAALQAKQQRDADGHTITAHIRDGKLHGPWTKKAGTTVLETGWYKGGQRFGRWTTHHADGSKATQGTFIKGRKIGLWREWNEQGQLQRELVVVPEVTDTGPPVMWGQRFIGKQRHYHPNGQLSKEECYAYGKPYGTWRWYDEAGKEIRSKSFTLWRPPPPTKPTRDLRHKRKKKDKGKKKSPPKKKVPVPEQPADDF